MSNYRSRELEEKKIQMDSLTSQLDKETLDKFRRIIGLEKEKKDMEDDMFYKEKKSI